MFRKVNRIKIICTSFFAKVHLIRVFLKKCVTRFCQIMGFWRIGNFNARNVLYDMCGCIDTRQFLGKVQSRVRDGLPECVVLGQILITRLRKLFKGIFISLPFLKIFLALFYTF